MRHPGSDPRIMSLIDRMFADTSNRPLLCGAPVSCTHAAAMGSAVRFDFRRRHSPALFIDSESDKRHGSNGNRFAGIRAQSGRSRRSDLRMSFLRLRIMLFREDIESTSVDKCSTQAQYLDTQRSAVNIWSAYGDAHNHLGVRGRTAARRVDFLLRIILSRIHWDHMDCCIPSSDRGSSGRWVCRDSSRICESIMPLRDLQRS